MKGYDQSKEAYERLKKYGCFEAVDTKVFNIMKAQKRALDIHELHKILETNGDPLGQQRSYNLVQQAFTRLSSAGKLIKVGTHKSMTGFTCGIYKVPTEDDTKDLFKVV